MSEVIATNSVFWNYSLDLYAREAVADSCLHLQNSYGLDVNLLLFSLWYTDNYGGLSQELVDAAVNFSQHWRQVVVQPLRETRQTMKSDPALAVHYPDGSAEDLRKQIKSLELRAEELQQAKLQQLAESGSKPVTKQNEEDLALKNLQALCASLGITLDQAALDQVAIISNARH